MVIYRLRLSILIVYYIWFSNYPKLILRMRWQCVWRRVSGKIDLKILWPRVCHLGSPKIAFLINDVNFFSDPQLEDAVKEIRSITPNIGQRRLLGALRARRPRIQRWRVRNCLRRQDPLGTALRWSTPVYHRRYSVPTPNALWHIDGNHKLTRCRFVVHCCVDGYSRFIVYATLTDNNRADTML